MVFPDSHRCTTLFKLDYDIVGGTLAYPTSLSQVSSLASLSPAILSHPMTAEEIQRFLDVTKTSSVGVPFSGTASHEWQPISLLQHHRRSPIHVHLPQEGAGLVVSRSGSTAYPQVAEREPMVSTSKPGEGEGAINLSFKYCTLISLPPFL